MSLDVKVSTLSVADGVGVHVMVAKALPVSVPMVTVPGQVITGASLSAGSAETNQR